MVQEQMELTDLCCTDNAGKYLKWTQFMIDR